jgi:murein DD-endopeptidase MepM/ murein hydrolase activator NlpD
MTTPTPGGTLTVPIPFGRILRQGIRANEVQGVKRALARELGINDPALGTKTFGATAAADLRSFQRRHNLAVDGVYGPRSHARLSFWFDAYAYLLYVAEAPPSTKTMQLPATFVPTHQTAGLPGYPAIDVFAPAGTRVLAPAAGTLERTHLILWSLARRVGGWTTYLEADDGSSYFLTHLGEVLPSGTTVKAGQDIGSVGVVPHEWWQAHVHEGKKAAL